jgi:hypothetical protein
MGHVGLNSFLHKIGTVNSTLCPRCHAPETVAHFLLHCECFNNKRRILKRALGKASCSLPRLLTILKNIVHIVKFVESTRRFKDYTDMGM